MLEAEILVPDLPNFAKGDLKVVSLLDKIRYEFDEIDDQSSEFYWFAREYPRFYRYHVGNIEFRISTIYQLYQKHKTSFLRQLADEENNGVYEISTSTIDSSRIYWDFEAMLGATGAALDILARIVGIGYDQETPVSLNKLSGKKNLDGLVDVFRAAKIEWIDRMKDYRDCFVHYTPVDNTAFVTIYKLRKNYKMWCRVPKNPNVRDVLGFEFSKKIDLLEYAIDIYKNLLELDRLIAEKIENLYNERLFPKRTNNLFFIGRRERK